VCCLDKDIILVFAQYKVPLASVGSHNQERRLSSSSKDVVAPYLFMATEPVRAPGCAIDIWK